MDPNESRARIEEARAGNREAFDAIFRAHEARLTAWVRSRMSVALRRRMEVEDIVHETELRAFQSIARFTWKGEDSFLRWMRVIAEHLIWNLSARRSGGELRLSVDPPDDGTSPSTRLRRNERFDRLEGALAQLSPPERDAVVLSRIDGLRIEEIAHRLKRSVPAVKSLLARSLRKLRASFGDTESLTLPHRTLGEREARDV